MNKPTAMPRGADADAVDLEALWLPFTPNRQFKQAPRLVSRAEGMYYFTPEGRPVLDAISGLWCSNAGHRHPRIVEAVKDQLDELDYACAFQMHHPQAFEFASALTSVAPDGFNHVFLVGSGSEACDTALKMALAYHKARGEGSRVRLIGREKGYHGVGFGGISVGGIGNNRAPYAGALLPGVDHLPHTLDHAHMAFSRGQPAWGVHLADKLEDLVALHGASSIAAVIVEPFSGSAGVIVPPVGYLERLREICDRHGILLIFDEVITGFGRLGGWFTSDRLDVKPDLITFAKGVTSAVVPLGGVLASDRVHDAFMQGPENAIEFFHGNTYSGHPLACAAGLATLEVYREEDLFARAQELERSLENAAHALTGEPHVIDIRNFGLAAAIELEPRPGAPGARGLEVFLACYEDGVMVRQTGDILAIAPALIASEDEVGRVFEALREALRSVP